MHTLQWGTWANRGFKNFSQFFFFWGGSRVFSIGGDGGVPLPLAKNLLIPPPPRIVLPLLLYLHIHTGHANFDFNQFSMFTVFTECCFQL